MNNSAKIRMSRDVKLYQGNSLNVRKTFDDEIEGQRMKMEKTDKKYQVVDATDTACRIAEMKAHFLSEKSNLQDLVENTMLYGLSHKPLLKQNKDELLETAKSLNLLDHLVRCGYIVEV